MARGYFGIEKALRIFGENSDLGPVLLPESSAPGASSDSNAAEVGSLYLRTDTGDLYRKKTAGSGTDKWVRMLTLDDYTAITFRNELVRAATTQAAPVSGSVIDLVATPLTGDDSPTLVAADFSVNDHIIFGVGGTPVLMRVSVSSGDEITVVTADEALADSDKFVVRNYLPDSPNAQEKQALVEYFGGVISKLADFNWNFADGIGLAASYAAVNGSLSSADTVNSAIEKLDGNQQDLITLSGVAQGATHLGTFTGTIIADSSTVKSALQSLETDLEALQSAVGIAPEAVNLGSFTGSIIPDNQTVKQALQSLETDVEERVKQSSASAITTAVTVDEINVDAYKGAVWHLVLSLDSDPSRVKFITISAIHNGVVAPGTPADATSTDNSTHSSMGIGTSFNRNISIDLNGTGASQTMRLRVSAAAAITVKATRVAIKN